MSKKFINVTLRVQIDTDIPDSDIDVDDIVSDIDFFLSKSEDSERKFELLTWDVKDTSLGIDPDAHKGIFKIKK
jgi:hypothetical protein